MFPSFDKRDAKKNACFNTNLFVTWRLFEAYFSVVGIPVVLCAFHIAPYFSKTNK